MTASQAIVFATLGGALTLFVWGRLRHDMVALLALLALVLSGVLPPERAFEGFAHPAVLTVAAVLVIGRALESAGLVDLIVRALAPLKGRMLAQLSVQTAIVALLSGFMNNVGALALMLPVALRQAYRDGYSPAVALMPLAFGSILGGLVTLIGTPPNLLVSAFRERELGEGYAMFAFAPVGAPVAVVGVAFVALLGWRLLPKGRRAAPDPATLFDVGHYVTELRVPDGSATVGSTLAELEESAEREATVLGVLRGGSRRLLPRRFERIEAGDVLVVRADPGALETLLGSTDLTLEEAKELSRDDLRDDDATVQEAVVRPGSRLLGSTSHRLRLRAVHGVNLLAVARHGAALDDRPSQVELAVGDVLLLHGAGERVADFVAEFGLLPLAERSLKVARPRRLLLATGIFVIAVATVVAGLVPVHVAFVAAAAALVLVGVIGRDEPYAAIDWPVIVLLAAMIPVGTAMELTGGTELIADAVLGLAGGFGVAIVVGLLMVATMMLSDVVNNNATAVLMAPIAISLAHGLGTSIDPLLMAVAIGASCAFLTPIGHQSNTLVLRPGGYRFGDYWRMGLPLEVVIVVVAVPLILLVWPP